MCEAKVGYVVRVIGYGPTEYFHKWYWKGDMDGVTKSRDEAHVYTSDELASHSNKEALINRDDTIIIPVRRKQCK